MPPLCAESDQSRESTNKQKGTSMPVNNDITNVSHILCFLIEV
jgi:hypothetical protein